MAFSTLFRTSVTVCGSRVFSQQLMKLATQASLQRPLAGMLPITAKALKELNSTPIINSVRSFRTSPVHMSGDVPHDHAKLWVIEKAVAAIMVPLIPITLMVPSKVLDSVLAVFICAHAFWGLEAIAIDYVRASVVGPILPKIALGLVYLFSIATLGGLFYIISHDVGLSNTIKQIWAIKADRQKS